MASGSSSDREKDKDSRWYFTAEQLANSPSRKCGIDADMELMYRQRGANLIQCMGQRLQVSQLCINTAIVYMHRFYAFHSFTHFHRNGIAAVSLFLAAKVEEQPRKLEHVIKEVHACLKMEAPEPTKESYAEQVKDLVFNENVLLQTLGFDVAIDHPHTHVVKTCHLVKASKDLAQTSYFMASNSLHLTTMCLQYRPTVVACFCIHLACKWSRWEIPQSTERKHWFQYVDKSVTLDLLQKLTDEFLHIFDRCPSRLKTKMKSMSATAQAQQRIEEPQRSLSGASSSNSQAITPIDGSSGSTSSSSHHRSHHSTHPHQHSKMPHAQPIGSGVSGGDHNSKSVTSTVTSTSSTSTSSGHKSAHPIPSSSNINRQRTDRPIASSSSTYVPTSNSHSSNSSSNKNLPSTLHGSSTGRPPSSSSSSSSSSQRSSSTHPGENSGYIPREPTIKNRNVANTHNHKPNDQRHLGKESTNSNSKSEYKSQSENSKTNANKAELYVSSKNSSLANMKQTQQYQQQQTTNIQTQPITSNRNQQQQLDHSVQKSFSESSFKQTDDLNRTVEPMQICTPPKQSKQSSIFSPDWKDNTNVNTSNRNNNSNNSNNSNNNNSINIKSVDSPTSKKQLFHYDKKSEQQKKEKKLDLSSAQVQQQQQNQSSEKRVNTKKLFDHGMPTIIPPTLLLDPVPQTQNKLSKRPFSDIALKQEDNIDFRDSKIRKIENDLNYPLINTDIKMISNNSSNSYDMTFNNDSRSSKSFLNTVNGIETNPVLVSSLLKEMCADNKFGSSLNSVNVGTTKLPGNVNLNIDPHSPNIDNIIDINHIEETLINDIKLSEKDEIQRSKSEKKKKKDKHKHKEKEKSKDERKKHKKDKERHKDREKDMKSPMSESSIDQPTSEGRLKITIPKEKLNLPAQDSKLKVQKDRLPSTHSTNTSSNQFYLSQEPSTGQTSSLKIKISKDMIENYNSSSSHTHPSDTHIHHSGKKKDRDKEREKQKTKSDFKQNLNGNGNNSNPSGGNSSINRNSSGSSATNQNKIQPPYTSSSNSAHYQQLLLQQQQQQQLLLLQQQQQQQQQYHQNNNNTSGGGHGRMSDYNKVAMGSNNNYFYPNRANNNNNNNNLSSNNK